MAIVGAILSTIAALIAAGLGLYHWLWLGDAMAGFVSFGGGMFISAFLAPLGAGLKGSK